MAEETEPPSAPTTVRVITETRNLRSPPFIAPEEPCATGNVWEEWLEGIEREFRYFKITDPVDKKDALIIYGGKQVAKLEKSLPKGGFPVLARSSSQLAASACMSTFIQSQC